MTGPIVIVDGNSMLVRSHFAMAASDLRTPDGTPAWALRGLWNLLSAACERVNASGMLVAFDSPRSFRSREYPDYKAGRARKDDDLKSQIIAAPGHVRATGVHTVVAEDFEADDVVASAARFYQENNVASVIVTSDRDAFSLITDDGPGVSLLRMVNGGAGNWPLLTASRLRILCGVDPGEYRLYAALRGDSSDNLPGVAGVGPKTAVKLIEYLRAGELSYGDLLADVDGDGTATRDALGATVVKKLSSETSRENMTRNLSMMAQVDTLPVGPIDQALFPVDVSVFATEMDRWAFRVTPSAFTPPRPFDDAHPEATAEPDMFFPSGLAPVTRAPKVSSVPFDDRDAQPSLF